MRRLVVGDIHGCYDKLQQALENCNFSDSDVLYSLGDFCDRGIQNVKVLDFLMSLKNFNPVIGNHDLWNFEYLHPDEEVTVNDEITGPRILSYHYMDRDAWECWYSWNGGRNTVNEEHSQSEEWKFKVYSFLKDIPFVRYLDNKVLIHTVFPKKITEGLNLPLEKITLETLKSSGLCKDSVYDSVLWNRDILSGVHGLQMIGSDHPRKYERYFREKYQEQYDGSKIYIIGHTPLDHPFYDKEMGIIGIDTGSFCDKSKGWDVDGCITVMDIDTLEYWSSKSKDISCLNN